MTKEEYEALPRYEKKSIGIYNEMKSDDDLYSPKVINNFCARNKNDPDINGVVKQIPQREYTIQVETQWVIRALKDKLYTKQGTLRKKYVDMTPWVAYDSSALMLYANQCYKEGSKYALLSWQERKWLLDK